MRWDVEGRSWPHRTTSRFVSAGGVRWHVQRMGRGPAALLIHGTGASTHSWRGLMPLLADRFTVVAPDLPGHGFTETPAARRLALPGMAAAVADLLAAEGVRPELAVGHSAGAAILARMALDGAIIPRALVSLNGAFLPFEGMAGPLFSRLARLLALNPLVPRLFSLAADRGAVERLIRDTGSTLDADGVELYRVLLRSPRHVGAALGMMARWELDPLLAALPRLTVPLRLVVGANDRAVAPDQAFTVKARVPGATVDVLPALGHLAHEERPDRVAEILRAAVPRPDTEDPPA